MFCRLDISDQMKHTHPLIQKEVNRKNKSQCSLVLDFLLFTDLKFLLSQTKIDRVKEITCIFHFDVEIISLFYGQCD